MRVRLAIAALVLGDLLSCSCGLSRLPAPPLAAQPSSALVRVPFPPPPPRVEHVPLRPDDASVWVDGEWVWQGRRWAWRRGRWVIPPPGARFSPWTAVRDDDGLLFVAEGAWRDEAGRGVDDPPPLALARTSAGPVVVPEGEEVPLPTLPPELPSLEDGGTAPDAS